MKTTEPNPDWEGLPLVRELGRRRLPLAAGRGLWRGLARSRRSGADGPGPARIANLDPAVWARLAALAYVHHRAGRKEDSDAARLELEARFAREAACQIAILLAERDEVAVGLPRVMVSDAAADCSGGGKSGGLLDQRFASRSLALVSPTAR